VLIVLEGVDGAGKGTQLALLRDALIARGRNVHVTAEPSTLPIGALLRKYLRRELTEAVPGPAGMALLFAADRMQHVEHEILPHLADGDVVLCDRYVASSIAYQAATTTEDDAQRDARMKWIAEINARARTPDLTFVLDLDPTAAAMRIARRGSESELFEHVEMQRRVRRNYRRIAELGLVGPMTFVDASTTPGEVHTDIMDNVP
jgi:dTMP kinase